MDACECCILVGQMKNALLEIRDKYRPDRVIIESSGSALPATLALQIRQLEGEFPGDFKLDSIATVVDAENFAGYDDESPTAKLQAKFCDVILINKWEHVSERQLDIVMDHLHTLNDLTPKLRCDGRKGVSSELIFGLDTKLYTLAGKEIPEDSEATTHMDEVETCTLWKGTKPPPRHKHDGELNGHAVCCKIDHSTPPSSDTPSLPQTRQQLEYSLSELPKEYIYRVKGFLTLLEEGAEVSYILNWAFGRFDLIATSNGSKTDLRLTIMGERGEVRRWARRLAMDLAAHLD